ncbi:response regulator [Desulfococcaceae bacterium HSG9]|nr:response regulator [Desulfococcaceae bacterium HSG9]
MGNILVVDDEKGIRITLGAFLRKDGHEVHLAEDVDAALNIMSEEKIDVVLTDIILPRVTGVELLKTIRKTWPHVQVVMITGEPTVETATEALRTGAFDYISKPVSKNAVLHVVGNAMKVKLLDDERRRLEEDNRRHREELERLVEERTRSLRESEETARVLLDSTPDAAMLIDKQGHILALNFPMAQRLKKRQKELIGKRVYDFYSTSLAESRQKRAEEVIRLKKPVYFQDEDDDKILENRFYPMPDELGSVAQISFFSRDVTVQKKLEQERILLDTAIRHVAESIVITNKAGTIQYVNPAFEKITGYTRAEAFGQNPRILKSDTHDAEFYKSMWATLTQGNIWNGLMTNRKKDETLYEEEVSISPIKNQSGAITNYVAVKRDVTEQTRLQEQVRQSQKMEAIGTLAGGIAHDFNNILFPLVGYAELALDQMPEGGNTQRYLNAILTNLDRAGNLVRQILTFCRKTNEKLRPMKIQPVIREVLKFIRSSFPSTITVRQEIDQDCGKVSADPTQIYQVVMNLCTNAHHAMKTEGGVLTVELNEIDVDPDDLFYKNLTAGMYLRLRVSDTGYGIKPEIMNRIFDPYFTTKEPEEGTGLGLAVISGIVRNFGGDIRVYSEPDRGTTFNVYLPRIDVGEDREPVIKHAAPPGDERILLIDDEIEITNFEKQILESLGYTVTALNSSPNALEMFSAQPDKFDLVITDMTMPTMTGAVLAEVMIRIRPDIPIILCSGFSENMDDNKARAIGIREYVMKPIVRSELAQIIRKVLDEQPDNTYKDS